MFIKHIRYALPSCRAWKWQRRSKIGIAPAATSSVAIDARRSYQAYIHSTIQECSISFLDYHIFFIGYIRPARMVAPQPHNIVFFVCSLRSLALSNHNQHLKQIRHVMRVCAAPFYVARCFVKIIIQTYSYISSPTLVSVQADFRRVRGDANTTTSNSVTIYFTIPNSKLPKMTFLIKHIVIKCYPG